MESWGASDQGFYSPGSITWRLSRERVMLIGGPRALLLQVAHPLVAAGVADFSSFRSDPLLRLRRTLDSTLALVFGDRATSGQAAARINAAHAQVHGSLPEPAGRYPAGTPYDATDPELLLWVHATLVDTTFAVYTRFVGPLQPDELEHAYEESKAAAQQLGIPPDAIPPNIDAFRCYVDEMLASDRLAGAPFQRAIARDVLYPPLRWVPRAAHRPTVAVTTALLPTRIRELFGLELTPSARRFTDWLQVVVRGILPVVPRVLRDMPQARRAVRRVNKGRS
jgi:uncharacterized protein (DUF2236 family)